MADLNQLPEEIVTEISMSEQKTWLILEGPSDGKFFIGRKFFTDVEYKVAYGWENVETIVTQSASLGDKYNVVGLIDRDYRDLNNKNPKHSKIVITDYRDIENIFFESNALRLVYIEEGSCDKCPQKKGSIDIDSIKKELNSVAMILGKYRAYCYVNGINMSFDDLNYEKFITRELEFEKDKFLKHLRGKGQNSTLISMVNWEKTQSNEWIPINYRLPVYIRQGHDLMAVVAISLKKKYGSKSGTFDHETIEKTFRFAIDNEEIKQFDFWKKLEHLLVN